MIHASPSWHTMKTNPLCLGQFLLPSFIFVTSDIPCKIGSISCQTGVVRRNGSDENELTVGQRWQHLGLVLSNVSARHSTSTNINLAHTECLLFEMIPPILTVVSSWQLCTMNLWFFFSSLRSQTCFLYNLGDIFHHFTIAMPALKNLNFFNTADQTVCGICNRRGNVFCLWSPPVNMLITNSQYALLLPLQRMSWDGIPYLWQQYYPIWCVQLGYFINYSQL